MKKNYEDYQNLAPVAKWMFDKHMKWLLVAVLVIGSPLILVVYAIVAMIGAIPTICQEIVAVIHTKLKDE